MAKALFVTTTDIKKFSSLNGNIDDDKLVQWISIAQDTHIQNFLGYDLFTKISNDIISNSISGDYLNLLNTYIKPMTMHYAIAEYLPFAAYTIANKGVYKHGSENAENVSKEEVDFLVQKHLKIAQNYTQRFLDYMCEYYTLFPEYTSNTDNEMRPSKNNNFNSWYF